MVYKIWMQIAAFRKFMFFHIFFFMNFNRIFLIFIYSCLAKYLLNEKVIHHSEFLKEKKWCGAIVNIEKNCFQNNNFFFQNNK